MHGPVVEGCRTAHERHAKVGQSDTTIVAEKDVALVMTPVSGKRRQDNDALTP